MDLFLPLALALLTPSSNAAEAPAAQRLATAGPPRHLVLDLDTGVYTELASEGDPGILCLDNSIDEDGAADALLVGAGDELVDWGVKVCGKSTFVQALTVGYASQAPADSGAMTVRVYSFTQGFGTLGTQVAELELVGLPTDITVGNLTPFYLTVELGSASFFLPEGPVGWSYQNGDGQTAPLLVDVHPSTGTQNWIDWYSPGPATDGHLEDTFSLGPGGFSNDPFENSLYMRFFEAPANPTASVASIENPANLSALFAMNTPVLGQTWSVGFDLTGVPAAGDATLVFLSLEPSFPTATILGVFLISPAAVAVTLETDDQHDFPILASPEFIGLPIFVQGIYTNGEPFLTNALVGTIGF